MYKYFNKTINLTPKVCIHCQVYQNKYVLVIATQCTQLAKKVTFIGLLN